MAHALTLGMTCSGSGTEGLARALKEEHAPALLAALFPHPCSAAFALPRPDAAGLSYVH
jgi:hypothetical protein